MFFSKSDLIKTQVSYFFSVLQYKTLLCVVMWSQLQQITNKFPVKPCDGPCLFLIQYSQ